MANLMKPEVLRLYKRIMRLSQTWNSINPSNTGEERRFIKDEARTWFQRNKQVDNIQQIKDHIQEAEARLEMALHYKNPHPRPINLPPKTYTANQGKKIGTAQQRLRDQSRPVYIKSIDTESGFRKSD